MNRFRAMLRRALLFSIVYLLFAVMSHAATIKVLPSSDSVQPGDSLWLDVVISNIPEEGLSAIQFRINVDAGDTVITGLSDLSQAASSEIAVASPLLTGVSDSASHIGSYFTAGQGPGGVLVMDNEQIKEGKGLYTFALTNGSSLPNGTGGAVARFRVSVGSDILADSLSVSLSDVVLLHGENVFNINTNSGAAVALNTIPAPADVTAVAAIDKSGDESGTIVFAWTPSISDNTTGYRIYSIEGTSETVVKDISDPASGGTELSGLTNGTAYTFIVKAYNSQSKESGGATVSVTPADDVAPAVSIAGVEAGIYYAADVTPSINIADANLSTQAVTLNGENYDNTAITTDGSYTLAVTAVDASGNESTGTVSFTIDKTSPSITVSGVSSGDYYSSDVTPSVDIADTNLSSQVVTLNSAPYDQSAITEEGSYTLAVTAVDEAGNESTSSISFAIDKTAPVITLSGATEGGSYSSAVSLNIGANDANIESTVVKLDGTEVDLADGLLEISDEGSHTVTVAVTDKAGHTTTKTIVFAIDLTVPVSQPVFAEGINGGYYATETISLSGSAEGASSVTLNTGGQQYTATVSADGGFTFTNIALAEGNNELSFTATSGSGSTSNATVITVAADRVKPIINVAGVADGSFYNGDVTLDLSVSDANLSGSTITLDGQAYSSGTAVSAEGEYSLVVTASDLAGNEASLTYSFTIDKTAPAVAVASVESGAYYASDVTPSVNITDANLSTQTVTLNGASYDLSAVTEEGSYTIAVTASDAAGNETTETISFTIDKTMPVVALSGATEGNWYNSALSISASAQDANLAGVVVKVDGSTVSTTGGTVEVSSEGSHTVTIEATDKAGHTNSETLSFNIDTTSPEEPVLAAGIDGSYVDTLSTAISGTAETGSTVTVTAGPETYTVTSSGDGAFTIENITLVEGINNITITVTDLAGNESSAAGITVTGDTLSPVITVAGIAEGSCYNADVTPEISATDANLSGSVITLNGQVYTSGTAITEEGDHSLVVTATDLAGHEASSTVTFTVDKTSPAIAVTGVENGSHYNANITPALSVTDTNLSGSSVTLNEEAFTEGTSVSAEGEYTLTVSATDLAGNEAAITVAFTIDKTAPAIAVSGVAGGAYYNSDVTPLVNVSDTYLSDQTVTLNGEVYASGSVIGEEGDYTLVVSISDLAGNEASSTIIFTVDKTAPVITVSGVENGIYYNSGITPVIGVTDINLNSASSTLNGSTYQESNAVSAEGSYRLALSAADKAGNSSTYEMTFYIDKTAPITTIETGEPSVSVGGILYVGDSAVFALSATDNGVISSGVSGIEYSIDSGQWMAFADSIAVNGLVEGNHTVHYRASDIAGNVADSVSTAFVVDRTAPETAIITGNPKHDGDNLYVTGATEYTLSSSDNLSGVSSTEYRIDGGEWLAYAPFTVPVEGEHTIEYRSADNLGNVEFTRNLAVVVDNTTPESDISSGEPTYVAESGTTYVRQDTAFTIAAADELSGVASTEYRVDGGDWSAYAPFTVAAEGEHAVEYRSTDNVGNVEASKDIAFTVDNTAPVTGITVGDPKHTGGSGELYVTKSAIFTLGADDNLSGVAKTEYRIDDGGWTAYAPFSIEAEGSHTIEYRSADNVGNVEAVNTLAVIVDNSAPDSQMSVSEPRYAADDGNIYMTSEAVITIDVSDNLSGVGSTEYRIGEGDWTAYAPISISEEGTYILTYRSTDNVGNVEIEKALTVIVDNTPPVSDISLDAYNYTSDEGILFASSRTVFSLSASDSSSGVHYTEYMIDDGLWTDYAPFSIEAEGGHAIRFRSIDRVGNVEAAKTLTVTIDTTPPATEIGVEGIKYTTTGGNLYITSDTAFTLAAADSLSGVAAVQYRLDGSDWTLYAPFKIETEGDHSIEFRSVDRVGNVEPVKSLAYSNGENGWQQIGSGSVEGGDENISFFNVIVDNIPPESGISVGEPVHTVANGTIYARHDSLITIEASDESSGVMETEYRLDSGDWATYVPFSIETEGSHLIEFRSTDNVGNTEETRSLSVIIDNTPPLSILERSEPNFTAEEGMIYVREDTVLEMTVSDNLSGVAGTNYSIDGGADKAYGSFNLKEEGEHTIVYRTSDNVENIEEGTIAVTADNTAPVTSIDFTNHTFQKGGVIYVSRKTDITLPAADNLAGVKETYYRFDGEENDRTYSGTFYLGELAYGSHTIHFYSRDNVENVEEVKSIDVVVIGLDVKTEVLNVPKVLVWTTDPSTFTGKDRKKYTLGDIKTFIASALNKEDIYYSVVTDRDTFKSEFRSGIYNIFVIIDEDNPFGAEFTKEMREAVNRGTGLVVSGWGNNIRPKLEEVVGLKFIGSLSMDADNNSIHMYQSGISDEADLVSTGKILKTGLEGAVLAGIVKGNEVCEGVKAVSLSYPQAIVEGDIVRVALVSSKGKGKKVTVLDEEEVLITGLPMSEIYNNPSSAAVDISIFTVNADTVEFALSALNGGYLDREYSIEVSVEHSGGSADTSGIAKIAASCDSSAGITITPFTVAAIDKDITSDLTDGTGQMLENLPAAVINDYGKGKAVMMTFNIIESAMNGQSDTFAGILNRAVTHVLLQEEKAEAAKVMLLEKTVVLHADQEDIRIEEILDADLSYEPLFDLNKESLEYEFTLRNSESYSYRYFVRTPDIAGDFFTESRAEFRVNGEYLYFDSAEYDIVIDQSSADIMASAIGWLEAKKDSYPDETDSIDGLILHLENIQSLPKATEGDMRKVIHDTVQFIDKLKQLSFDTSELRLMLDGYIRILENVMYYLD